MSQVGREPNGTPCLSLSARRVGLLQEMEAERVERVAEAAALSEEKARLHEETEKQREEQHQWAIEQQTLLHELVESQRTIRQGAPTHPFPLLACCWPLDGA